MYQDTIQTVQTSGQSPRFRPFASSVHHVTKGRYITSNDPRGYIPVYEYPLNSQWIMMDIDDGYILWTGIWKALGNSKADIVKMIDSQPELAHVIRRVRGGYLKIQGTWMPFDVALRLARRVAWTIREDLIPLFGPDFPSTCLSPDQPGYGQVVASASGRRRARRNPQPGFVPLFPAHNRIDWSMNGQNQLSLHQPSPFAPVPPLSGNPAVQYPTNPLIYPVDLRKQGHHTPSSRSPSLEHLGQHRYMPYPAAPSDMPPRRPSASSRNSLSLDIPALRLSLRDSARTTPSPSLAADPIQLPAIQPRASEAQSTYALPPISALEDLRGIDTHDSAAVLRRLRSDDDEDLRQSPRIMRRSLSAPATKISIPLGADWFTPRRSLGHIHDVPDSRMGNAPLRVSVPSDSSRDGDSTCDPSPVSPATPRSAVLGRDQLALVPLSILKEQSRMAAPYSFPVTFSHNDWLVERGLSEENDSRISACRYSCMTDSSEGAPVPLTLR
ncbi:hypothetical protein DFH07DRAFT_1014563 [Mycena maculata]|uniref:HTH APSES-type domain-containing protein n=1 Tax=Mycena maculata TaxID=230809 RepID=A0AAD7NLW2_9AGAR|nr:hypothetical protein DFH07DRAFT_1014563 [Mycena maculata]